MRMVRALITRDGRDGRNASNEAVKRSLRVGAGGLARKAIEKSRDEVGDEGVTIMAGRGDFSVTEGNESKDKSTRRLERTRIQKIRPKLERKKKKGLTEWGGYQGVVKSLRKAMAADTLKKNQAVVSTKNS